MARIDELYAWLARGPTPDCDQILAAALEHAEPPYFERIVTHLLERGNDASWVGLIAQYPRLAPEARQRLGADPERMRAGLARAVRAGSTRCRLSALAALAEQPCPRLAYVLPDTLRDSSDQVRRAAAKALRRIAETVLDDVGGSNTNEPRSREHALARAEVSKALFQALRTFDLHFCPDVVEVSLWFSRDLGNRLWDMLSNRRSQCGAVLGLHLASWNSPHLARFLVEALTTRPWRVTAQQILRNWRTPAEITAVLRNSDLLANAEVRRWLAGLHDPPWFQQFQQKHVAALPADLRIYVPRWVRHLGYSPNQKVALLSGWLHAGTADMQRACLHALAGVDTPEALERLAQVAGSKSPLAPFARWYLASAPARRRGVGAVDANAAPESHGEKRRATAASAAAKAEAAVWPAWREQIREEDAALTALIQEDLEAWRTYLIEYMRSDDPRDRLLALRALDGASSLEGFEPELRRLQDDPLETIRKLAAKIRDTARTRTGAAPATDAPPRVAAAPAPENAAGSADAAAAPTPVAARQQLTEALEELLRDEEDPAVVAELVQQVHGLLRQTLSGGVDSPDHSSSETETRS
jgi:hypothetical protein